MSNLFEKLEKHYKEHLHTNKEEGTVDFYGSILFAEFVARDLAINFALDVWEETTGNKDKVHQRSYWMEKLDKFIRENYGK